MEQIKLNVREYTCVMNWKWRAVFTRNAIQEIEESKKRCYIEENGATQQKLNENIPCSKIRNREQWVFYGVKYENYKNDWNLWKIQKSSKILIHRAVLALPTFHIKLVFLRVPKSPAAIQECSEIHERIWVFQEALLIVNLTDECLKNYIKIQEIWQHHRGFREERELRKVGVKSHCNQHFYLVFR